MSNMSSLRVLVKSAEYGQSLDNDEDSGKTLESVVLEIMCGNARDVHGGWMNVFMLSVNNKEGGGTGASLRSSLQAETSATVSMKCSIRTCAACAHSTAGHDLDAELMQLENTCYAAK